MSSQDSISVLFLATFLEIGGAERTWIDLVPYLDENQFTKQLLCFKRRGRFGQEMAARGVTVIDHFMKSKYDITILWRLYRFLRKNKVQIVVTLEHDDVLFWGRLAAKLARVPVCLTVVHTTNRRGQKKTFNMLNQMMMPLTTRLIATAKGSFDHIVEQGIPESKVHLIYNGVDVDQLVEIKKNSPLRKKDFGIPEEGKVVGMLAGFRPEKAHVNVLLPAAKEVISQYPDTYFLLVGDGVERPAIEAAIQQFGIEKNVVITGFREDAADVLSVFDISMLCSYPQVETFSLSILESMAAGIPIVVTKVGSLDEMVFNDVNGYTVPHSNPTALAEALLKILSDDELAQKMGQASQEIAIERFHRNRMVRETEELFIKLLKEQGKEPLLNDLKR